MNINLLINIIYIISALFFIAGLKMMTSPSTARSGNMISASGMLIAILTTLLDQGIIDYIMPTATSFMEVPLNGLFSDPDGDEKLASA